MKVVLKERILTDVGYIEAGAIVDLPNHIASQWIRQDKARPYKPPSKIETATLEPGERAVKPSGKRSKRTKCKT
jgi:hypothetical protein